MDEHVAPEDFKPRRPEGSIVSSLVRLAAAAVSPNRAWLSLIAAALLSCFASVLRQRIFEYAWGYALLLALFAFVAGFVPWLFVTALLLGGKKVLGGWRPEEAVPLRARLVAVAAVAFASWVGYGITEKYGLLPLYGREGGTKGNLGSLRSALSIYYGDHDGVLPRNLAELPPKYLVRIPAAFTRPHGEVTEVRLIDAAAYESGKLPDSGGWAYIPSGPSSGTVIVDCVHSDIRGVPYISY